MSAPELLSRFKRSISRVVIASEPNKNIIGFAVGTPLFNPLRSAPAFELWAIFVEPAYRRMGVGKALIFAVENLARCMGCIDLHVSAQAAHEVEKFYSTLGYRPYALRFRNKIQIK